VLRLQLLQHAHKVGQSRLLLLHHSSGGFVDEAGVGKLALRLGDFTLDAGDFLGQSGAFLVLV